VLAQAVEEQLCGFAPSNFELQTRAPHSHRHVASIVAQMSVSVSVVGVVNYDKNGIAEIELLRNIF
jgi:hypothetical protein